MKLIDPGISLYDFPQFTLNWICIIFISDISVTDIYVNLLIWEHGINIILVFIV